MAGDRKHKVVVAGVRVLQVHQVKLRYSEQITSFAFGALSARCRELYLGIGGQCIDSISLVVSPVVAEITEE